MKQIGRGICLLVLVSLVFFSAGCAKKKIEQVGEVTPPTTQEKEIGKGEGAGPKPGEMGMPGASKNGGEVLGGSGSNLQGEAATFENEDIRFDYDSFSIRPEDKKILSDKAAYMKANPSVKARVEGHCDDRGTTEYNLALGERRAKAASDYLKFLGIDASRLSTVSFGEEKPLDPAQTEEAYAKNRRAHFVIVEK